MNNWFVICGGFVAVTSTWARLFFVAWWIVGVLVCLNVVVAFAIDSFMSISERSTTEQVQFEASTVTGTETGLEGEYVANVPARAARRRSVVGRRLSGLLTSVFSPRQAEAAQPPLGEAFIGRSRSNTAPSPSREGIN